MKKYIIPLLMMLVCLSSCQGRMPRWAKMEMSPASLVVNGEEGTYEVSSNCTIRMVGLVTVSENGDTISVASQENGPYGGFFDLGWLKMSHSDTNSYSSLGMELEANETGSPRIAVLRIIGTRGDWYFPEHDYYIYQESN